MKWEWYDLLLFDTFFIPEKDLRGFPDVTVDPCQPSPDAGATRDTPLAMTSLVKSAEPRRKTVNRA